MNTQEHIKRFEDNKIIDKIGNVHKQTLTNILDKKDTGNAFNKLIYRINRAADNGRFGAMAALAPQQRQCEFGSLSPV